MAILNIAPTKSALLTLKHQLGVAEEGYDLLEQKRQILVFEMMSRLRRAQEVEQRIVPMLSSSYKALQEATLDVGAIAIEQAMLAIHPCGQVDLTTTYLMGLKLPKVTSKLKPPSLPFGVRGTSANTDIAMSLFVQVLPLLSEWAELQNVILRLAAEFRKTQRRCNALIKIFIPNYHQTIDYIAASLEEREREAFVIVRMIRDRLAESVEPRN